MNPLFRIDFSISDSLKIVRKSVLIYETIILLKLDDLIEVFISMNTKGEYTLRLAYSYFYEFFEEWEYMLKKLKHHIISEEQYEQWKSMYMK